MGIETSSQTLGMLLVCAKCGAELSLNRDRKSQRLEYPGFGETKVTLTINPCPNCISDVERVLAPLKAALASMESNPPQP